MDEMFERLGIKPIQLVLYGAAFAAALYAVMDRLTALETKQAASVALLVKTQEASTDLLRAQMESQNALLHQQLDMMRRDLERTDKGLKEHSSMTGHPDLQRVIAEMATEIRRDEAEREALNKNLETLLERQDSLRSKLEGLRNMSPATAPGFGRD